MLSPDKISRQIRALREAKGYSQEYMAGMLHVSQSTYAYLESGKVALRVRQLFEIMDILGTNLETLLDLPPAPVSNNAGNGDQDMSPSTRHAYELLISEMKSEIDFLRSMLQTRDRLM